MSKDVSAGSAGSTTLGQLALGLTLLAFGIGATGVVDNVAAADASAVATWVGGVALFIAGLLAFRDRDTGTGTAFAGLGAFWFTWGTAVGEVRSAEAAGLFALLWALLALSLTAGATRGSLVQGAYGLLAVAMALTGIGALADSGGLGEAGGWVAVAAGLASWYGATAALADLPTFEGRAAGRGVTATG